MTNPFKFGTIVDDEFFTDRVEEQEYIKNFLNSTNHLVLISPRRFGKTSLVSRVLKSIDRPHIQLNLQSVTNIRDFAATLLKLVLQQNKLEKIRHNMMHFRIAPVITTNPMTGAIEIGIQPTSDGIVILEDVFALMDKISSDKKKLIVVFDEFQEIKEIDKNLDKKLRSIMQTQSNINYILLGSQESMMTEIFEKKKSPFYHFGQTMRLKKIPRSDFHNYVSSRLIDTTELYSELTEQILDFTQCHPYYTQQLASQVWITAQYHKEVQSTQIIENAVLRTIEEHDLDYERLWLSLNKTDRWVLQQLTIGTVNRDRAVPPSTVHSSLKRLQKAGYVIFTEKYDIDDPFFSYWIKTRRYY